MKKYPALIGLLCIIMSTGFSQTDGSKPVVQKAIYFDVSPPLRDMVKSTPEKADNSWKVIKNYFNARKNNRQTFSSDWVDPLIQHNYKIPTTTQDSTIQNFQSNSNTQGYDPPDTYGQVGPNHYFSLVNCHFSIYGKAGTLLLGPVSTSTLWSGMPHNMNGGDGVVIYDADADRWLIAQLSYPTGYNLEMIAVSQTNDPTGSWYRWEYTFTGLPDYPKIGVWPDGYYMSVNRFNSAGTSFLGTGQAVFDRSAMLVGDPSAQMIYFTLPASNNAYSLLPSSCDGEFPPADTPNYFVYMNDSPDYLGVYEFHVDWTTPGNSTFGNYLQLPVTTFDDNLSGIPQKGTTRQAGTLSDRLMYRLQFRAFSDHWSMVCNHSVNVGSNVAGIRWYELQKSTGPWSVYQQSTYSPADGNCRWMGSAAMDTAGNIALGFSISSSTMYPAIKFTGRLKNDPLNAMTIPEKGIYYGTGSNTASDAGSNSCRWGDYSSMTVDPSDGTTFWYSQQYLTSMGSNWKIRVASFNFLGFNVTATATPASICLGDSTQLNATATYGSGTYSFSWTSLPAGFSSTIKNPKASPIITTIYIVAVNDGTITKTDSIQVVVGAAPPTANAGPNASYPNTTAFFPVAGTATNYSSVKWLTAGDGSFTTDTALNSVYNTGANDMNNGGVLLTLKANPIRPCSVPALDTVFITLTFPVGVVPDATAGFDVSILPNPTAGLFNLFVRGSMNKELSIIISDIAGKTIFRDQDRPLTQEYSRAIDLTGFPRGIYFIKAQTDVHLITKKLVIQ